jgi:hypothetical protein
MLSLPVVRRRQAPGAWAASFFVRSMGIHMNQNTDAKKQIAEVLPERRGGIDLLVEVLLHVPAPARRPTACGPE